MEFYLSFHELLGRGGNSVAVVILPLFLTMIVLEDRSSAADPGISMIYID